MSEGFFIKAAVLFIVGIFRRKNPGVVNKGENFDEPPKKWFKAAIYLILLYYVSKLRLQNPTL